jgi:hypothetical protein
MVSMDEAWLCSRYRLVTRSFSGNAADVFAAAYVQKGAIEKHGAEV